MSDGCSYGIFLDTVMIERNRIARCFAPTVPLIVGMMLFACAGSDDSPGANSLGGDRGTGGESNTGGSQAVGGNSALGGSSLGPGGTFGTGGASAAGNPSGGGSHSVSGGNPGSGGAPANGGTAGSGGAAANGGTTGSGGSRQSTGGSRATGGAFVTGGTRATGGSSSAVTTGAGGRQSTGGSKSSGGTSATGGVGQTGGAGGSSGTGCPYTGHVSYTLATVANPSTTEQNAYTLIRAAMDKAVQYYNCYTNITKSLNISYVSSVSTADGNINGSIRFGSNTTYMDYRTAMHEISHTVGIGTASKWASCVDMTNKLYTCTNGKQQLSTINGQLAQPADTTLHADNQHFWPYGINQQSEVKSEADLIYHCQMVMAMLEDLA